MLAVIKASILYYLRERKSLLFHLIFPIFLVLLLGNVLSLVMDNSSSVNQDDIQVYYLDEGSENTRKVFDILKNIKSDVKMKFAKADSIESGKEKVRTETAVLVHLNGENIDYYANDRYAKDSSIVYSMLNGIIEEYNTKAKMFEINPQVAMELTKQNEDTNSDFKVEKIASEKTPSAMGYYGVAELGLMVFYFFSMPLYQMKVEKRNQIKDRIKTSGLTNRQFYFGKFIGISIICYISILLSYLILKYAFSVEYGDNALVMPISLLVFVVLVVGFGTIVSMIVKDNDKADVIVSSAVIPFLCLMGGGYVALDNNLGKIGNIITRISPLRSFNVGIFEYIYQGKMDGVISWIIGGGISIIIMMLIMAIISRREDIING